MPVYEYRCKSCGRTHEIEHGFHDERPSKCPACSGPLARVFHPVGVHFKGSGFYKTDSSGSHARKEPAASGASSESAKADGKADSPKPDSPKKSETKPASEGSSSTAKAADPKPPSSSS